MDNTENKPQEETKQKKPIIGFAGVPIRDVNVVQYQGNKKTKVTADAPKEKKKEIKVGKLKIEVEDHVTEEKEMVKTGKRKVEEEPKVEEIPQEEIKEEESQPPVEEQREEVVEEEKPEPLVEQVTEQPVEQVVEKPTTIEQQEQPEEVVEETVEDIAEPTETKEPEPEQVEEVNVIEEQTAHKPQPEIKNSPPPLTQQPEIESVQSYPDVIHPSIIRSQTNKLGHKEDNRGG